jgi:hypothetical protein
MSLNESWQRPNAPEGYDDNGRRRHDRSGSHPAVPLTSGGRLLSDVKLKHRGQELTLGSKVGLLQEAAVLRGGFGRPGVASS